MDGTSTYPRAGRCSTEPAPGCWQPVPINNANGFRPLNYAWLTRSHRIHHGLEAAALLRSTHRWNWCPLPSVRQQPEWAQTSGWTELSVGGVKWSVRRESNTLYPSPKLGDQPMNHVLMVVRAGYAPATRRCKLHVITTSPTDDAKMEVAKGLEPLTCPL